MKRILMCGLILFGFSGYSLGVDHGTVGGHLNTLNSGDSITYLLDTGSVGVMEEGSLITNMYGTNGGTPNSSVTTMNGGTISYMHNETSVYEMFGGTVTTIAGNSPVFGGSYVTNMHNGYVGLLSNGSYITNMYDGTINNMTNYGAVRNLSSGTISQMSGNTQVENMINGTIGNMQGNANIGEMTDGTVANMAGSSKITTMNDGTVTAMNDTSSIGTMNDGTVVAMNNNSKIEKMNGGTVTDMNDWSKIELLTGGTVKNVNGNNGNNTTIERMEGEDAVIENMRGNSRIYNAVKGTIKYITDTVVVSALQDGAVIELMEGESNVEHVDKSTIDIMQGSSTVNNVYEGSKIKNMKEDAYVENFYNGEVQAMEGGSKIGNLYAGTVFLMKDRVSITTVTADGVIAKMEDNSNIDLLWGGTVTLMEGDSSVTDFNGGIISSMSGNANVVNLHNGTISSMTDDAGVDSMTWGEIAKMEGNSSVTSFAGGKIVEIDENALIGMLSGAGRIDKMNGMSTVGNMTGGVIGEMNSGTVTAMDGGTIVSMNGGSVNTMNGGLIEYFSYDSQVKALNSGTITNMYGGKVGDIGAGGVISTIYAGTIYGDVANGASLNITDLGRITLDDGGLSKTFDGTISAGEQTLIIAKSYNFGTNSAFNIGDRGTVTMGEITLNKVNFLGTGTMNMESFAGNTHGNATIKEFSAADKVTFDFYLDFEHPGNNDYLVIEANNGVENKHYINVANVPPSVTVPRNKINLIEDQSASLLFTLANGNIIGLGAKNYALGSENAGSFNQWFLGLTKGLSDGANAIGSMPTANLMSIHSLQETLTQRMGDIRNYSAKGLWTRVYTNQTKFDNLAETEISNYGMEVGYDMEVAKFEKSRIMLGIGGGANYADIFIKSRHSRDGGGNSTMPYGGLYATLLADCGFYVDVAARYAYNVTEGYYYGNMNEKETFDIYGHSGIASLEAGKQFYLAENFILEPRAKFDYVYMTGGESFEDKAGFRAEYGDTRSLLGGAGLVVRYDIGKFKPYAKATYMYEFDGRTDIVYDNTSYDSDVRGWRGEGAAGFSFDLSSSFILFGEAGYQGGEQSYSNINGNLGVRYSFGKVKTEPKEKKAEKTKTRKDSFEEIVKKQEPQKTELKEENTEKSAPAAEEEAKAEPVPAFEPAVVKEEPKPEVKAAPVIKEEEVAKIEVGKTVKISGGNFVAGKAAAGPKTEQSVRESAAELKNNEFSKIIITGHTDSTGSKALNDRLSLQRAQSIAGVFADEGIEKEKIETIGKGSSEPVATNATAAGRAENRRVEIEVVP